MNALQFCCHVWGRWWGPPRWINRKLNFESDRALSFLRAVMVDLNASHSRAFWPPKHLKQFWAEDERKFWLHIPSWEKWLVLWGNQDWNLLLGAAGGRIYLEAALGAGGSGQSLAAFWGHESVLHSIGLRQCKWCSLVTNQCKLCKLVANFANNANGVTWWTNFEPIQVVLIQGRHLVAKFSTVACNAIWWPNLLLMQVAPSGGQSCN